MAAIRNWIGRRKYCYLIVCVCVSATLIYLYSRTAIAWERIKDDQEQIPSTFLSDVTEYFSWMLSGASRDRHPDATKTSPLFHQHLLTIVQEDFQGAYIFLVTWLCLFIPREITSVAAGVILVCLALFTSCLVIQRFRRSKGSKRDQLVVRRNGSVYESPNMSATEDTNHGMFGHLRRFTYGKTVGVLLICAFLCSLPWEFVRLYQIEVAKKMANLQAGVPKECVSGQASILESLKFWLYDVLSWQQDPCEKYYRMLMVDPLWEVTPLMVVYSIVTRCGVYVLELCSGGVGRSLALFFSEIPLHWQPVMIVAVFIIIFITIIIMGGYRLHIPFLFKMEPKTPVIVNKNVVVYQNRSAVQKSIDQTPRVKQGSRDKGKPPVKKLLQSDKTSKGNCDKDTTAGKKKSKPSKKI